GFATRSEHAWQAALGLDRKRRLEAEQLLLAELRSAPSEARRQDLAVAAAALGDLSPETAATAAEALAQALGRATDPNTRTILAQGLSAMTVRLGPRDAVAVLTQAMSRTTDPGALRPLVRGLLVVAARLEARDAAVAAAALIQAMSKAKGPDT